MARISRCTGPNATLLALVTATKNSMRTIRDALESAAEHRAVNRGAGKYVRGDAYTNTVEGFFSVFKRGMTGVYQHWGSDHLHRYLAEFDFRYNDRSALGIEDAERAANALQGISDKRLTYRISREAQVI